MTGIALRQLVEGMFHVVRDRSSNLELVIVCPEPSCGDESGNRGINLKTGKTFCWRCNKGGDFVKWARFLGYSVEDDHVKAQAQPLEELDFRVRRDVETKLPVIREVRLPRGFCYCHEHPTGLYTELIAEMAQRKHLTIQDLFEARVGYTKIDPKWEPYAIFPVVEDRTVVYYQGRTYVDTPGESTKRFPTRTECPNSSKFWVYNIDQLRREGGIALAMESILNVLSMRRFFRQHAIAGIVPICVFKHYLSKPQARKLFEVPGIREVCLLYDHDATRLSFENAPTFANHVALSVAEMPAGPGGAKNDPNDDPEAAWEAFRARKVVDSLSSLRFSLRQGRPAGRARPQTTPTSPLNDLHL